MNKKIMAFMAVSLVAGAVIYGFILNEKAKETTRYENQMALLENHDTLTLPQFSDAYSLSESIYHDDHESSPSLTLTYVSENKTIIYYLSGDISAFEADESVVSENRHYSWLSGYQHTCGVFEDKIVLKWKNDTKSSDLYPFCYLIAEKASDRDFLMQLAESMK